MPAPIAAATISARSISAWTGVRAAVATTTAAATILNDRRIDSHLLGRRVVSRLRLLLRWGRVAPIVRRLLVIRRLWPVVTSGLRLLLLRRRSVAPIVRRLRIIRWLWPVVTSGLRLLLRLLLLRRRSVVSRLGPRLRLRAGVRRALRLTLVARIGPPPATVVRTPTVLRKTIPRGIILRLGIPREGLTIAASLPGAITVVRNRVVLYARLRWTAGRIESPPTTVVVTVNLTGGVPAEAALRGTGLRTARLSIVVPETPRLRLVRTLSGDEPRVVVGPRQTLRAGRTIRKISALGRWSHRQLTAHHPRPRQIARGCTHKIIAVDAALPEIARSHAGDTVPHPSVAIDIRDVGIVDDGYVVVEPTGVAASIPGMEALIRSERNPAHMTEPEAYAESGAPSKEADQSRAPVVMRIDRTGPPAPAE